MPGRTRTGLDVAAVLDLTKQGCTDRKTSAATGVPVNTIRSWRSHGLPNWFRFPATDAGRCRRCGEPVHDFEFLAPETYAYLLGLYLGDGCLTANHTSWTLRITLDSAYPGIVDECRSAVQEISGGRYVAARPRHGLNCLEVSSTWRAWLCLFPQHGPGRKHQRTIALADWQQRIIAAAPKPFLRALIQTDGWRGLNRVHVKGKDYAYPRYQFSNRSDDIRKLFTDTCERLGIEWRQWTRYHVSVARRPSVALMDTFIGPKH